MQPAFCLTSSLKARKVAEAAAKSAAGIGTPSVTRRRLDRAAPNAVRFSYGSSALEHLRVRRFLLGGSSNPSCSAHQRLEPPVAGLENLTRRSASHD